MKRAAAPALACVAFASLTFSQTPQQVLVVVNDTSPLSRSVGEYYARQRHIPVRNICRINSPAKGKISRAEYDNLVSAPISRCLLRNRLQESVLYIVTTAGVPLVIADAKTADVASVDSELTLLYSDLRGRKHPTAGPLPNPFFRRTEQPFRHPDFPIYLVTRLEAYNFEEIKGIIDRALVARNTGKFVIDMRDGSDEPGNDWLRAAAAALPRDRVILDETTAVLKGITNVIGYASWGSNDHNRKERFSGFRWLPGGIATEFVSTDGRTFERPPDNWQLGTWKDRATWFAGSPQSLTADLIHEGATGASGHVAEPYLQMTPRPDFLLPAYYQGRTLAESYYLAIPVLSWQNIVIGDPLCSLGKPR